jgi:hypothetical protein
MNAQIMQRGCSKTAFKAASAIGLAWTGCPQFRLSTIMVEFCYFNSLG